MYYLTRGLHEIEKMDGVTSALLDPPMRKGNKQARYQEDNLLLSEIFGYKISRKKRCNKGSCTIISVRSLLNG